MTTSTRGEITIVPFPGHGHVFPAVELAHRLASLNYHITLLLPFSTSSSPSTPLLHPLIHIVESDATPEPHHHHDRSSPLRDLLTKRTDGRDPSSLPLCVIVDVMMRRELEICKEFSIPAVSFFTSSACSTAFDHATRKISLDDLSSRDILTVPGLPDDISITLSDLAPRRPPPPRGSHPPPPLPFGPVHHHGVPPPGGSHALTPRPPPRGGHPPGPPAQSGHLSPSGPPPPPGLEQTDGTIALLFNTCDDLERPFIEYIPKETKRPVWAVGPLLPARFWEASMGSSVMIHDDEIRPTRDSSFSETEIIQWLDSKPRGSVIYVSFGTVVGLGEDELAELAAGLEESSRPFIWVLQAGSETSRELARRAGHNGLVVEGWAPQLLILSHESTGGFISHCGWNSTVEAIGLGVPMLTWPVHGDQVYNAKLVTSRLKTGYPVADGSRVTKDHVVRGIERLMMDFEMRTRAASLRAIFKDGFPRSSSASLEAFLDFLNTKLM
ncbi:UDP-glucuronosyl/UDP-glucosyltransferase protein [Dioscorea alata]|uniref:UDP-glucuronosyl/UDP-glucosyltransferase protein n=1 Tax=Dioscorea alata TaxID=55571 RepID=A0ACB7V5T6_DIOAL|nr:UDP-glucuronosyl/UDP-glucosyltransferase protein [Dioscorea alata]